MKRTILSFTVTLLTLGLFAQDLSNGLLLHYDFNGNSNDVSGNNMHGTVYGATLTNDKDGNSISAYYFDGLDDYIDLPNDPSLKPQLPVTISCYVKVEDFSSYPHHRFFNTDFTLNTYTGVMLSIGQNGDVAINFGDGTPNITGYQSRRTGQTPTGLFNVGEWVHIVAIARGAEDFEIYVNCIKQKLSFSGEGGAMAYTSNSGVIGKHDQVTTDLLYFRGSIDEIRYWNRDLTQAEVELLCSILSIQQNSKPTLLKSIYPNPSNGIVTLVFEDNKPVNINLYDITGKLILNHNDYKGFELTIKELKQGVYFVKVFNDTHQSTKRIVITSN